MNFFILISVIACLIAGIWFMGEASAKAVEPAVKKAEAKAAEPKTLEQNVQSIANWVQFWSVLNVVCIGLAIFLALLGAFA